MSSPTPDTRSPTPLPPRRRRSLRGPMLRAVAVLILGLFVLLAIPLHYLFLGSFRRLEAREAERNVERALNALTDDVAELSRVTRDYAQWDSTHAFALSADPAYLTENYADLTFYNNRWSFAAIVDLHGKVLFSKAADLQGRTLAEPPLELTGVVAPVVRPFLRETGQDQGVSGVAVFARGPAYVAAHAILRSTGEGPVRGTVIIGRWLNAYEAERLAERARLELQVHRLDAADLPPDVVEARARVTPWSRTTTQVQDESTICGYGLVTGIDGQPAIVLRVPQAREVWAQGFRATMYLLLSLVVVGLAFALLLVIALERLVLSRISALDREVGNIGDRGDVSLRVVVRGDDELGRLASRINEMLGSVERLNRLLAREQEQSERLLLNVLPKPVAERLKADGGVIADGFDDVSVVFADLVEFTNFSTEVSAARLVSLLDAIFTRFDELVDRHGMEKIKTIGDAYMAVAGLPERRPDHARSAARMALDMRSALFDFNAENGTNFNLRIGIHCGPVVAGVIGRRKFIYDIWGDTVNTASRMESHGLKGEIQVSADFAARISDEFEVKPRGSIPVKGKGEMPVFLLVGRRVPATVPSA